MVDLVRAQETGAAQWIAESFLRLLAPIGADEGFGISVGVTGDLAVNERRTLALRIELSVSELNHKRSKLLSPQPAISSR